MTSTIALGLLNHPSFSMYNTPSGKIAVFPGLSPKSWNNPYGFTIRYRPAAEPGTRFNPRIAKIKAFLTPPSLASIRSALPCGIKPKKRGFYKVVPPILRNHLIIIKPPLESVLPIRHPTEDRTRIWLSSSTVTTVLQAHQNSYVREVYVPEHPSHLIGSHRAEPGDVVFIEKTGYYLTSDIGLVSSPDSSAHRMVAMEARTVTKELVILYLPHKYVTPPEIRAELCIGEEESEDEGESEEKTTD